MLISSAMSFVIPLMFILGISLTNSIIFKKNFEMVLPVGLMECAVILYLTGFINLRIGFYICIFLSALSIPLLFLVLKKQSYSLKEYFVTDMLKAFLILYFIIFTLNLGKTLSHWDEFSHWGVMAKELFRMDKYYYLEESPLMRHKDYPPFTSILQYLWCCLCGGYKERHLYNAEMIFSLSLILSLFSHINSKNENSKNLCSKIISSILIPVFIIILTLCHTMGEASFYQTIYTESILACLILYGFFLFVFDDKFSYFTILRNTLIMISLLLIKQIAIYFFAILFLVYVIGRLMEHGLHFYKDKKIILTILCMFIFPFILWSLWSNAVAIHAPAGQFDSSNFSLTNISNYLAGNGEKYQYITTYRYFTALFQTPIITKPLAISYVPLVFILFLSIIGIARLEKKCELKKKIYLLGFSETITCLLYIGVMFISYLFGFHPDESINLACYNRYMSSMLYPFILSIIILFVYVLYRNYSINKNILLTLVSFGCILFLIPFATLKYELLPGIFCDSGVGIYENDSQNIINTTPENAKVLVIRQGDTGSSINIIAYQCLPRTFDDDFFSFGKPYSDEDIYTLDYTVEEFTELLENFDYLYTGKIDEQFIAKYSSVFGNIEITNNLTFKIEQNQNGEIFLDNVTATNM